MTLPSTTTIHRLSRWLLWLMRAHSTVPATSGCHHVNRIVISHNLNLSKVLDFGNILALIWEPELSKGLESCSHNISSTAPDSFKLHFTKTTNINQMLQIIANKPWEVLFKMWYSILYLSSFLPLDFLCQAGDNWVSHRVPKITSTEWQDPLIPWLHSHFAYFTTHSRQL